MLSEFKNYLYLYKHGIAKVEDLVGRSVYFVYSSQGVTKKQIRKISYHMNNRKWIIDAGSVETVENLGVNYFLSEKEAVRYQFEILETYTKKQQERLVIKELEKREQEVKELWRLLEKYPDEESRKLVGKSCKTCKHNVVYPEPHTCDVCMDLENDEDYTMWEPKIDLFSLKK